MLVKFSENQKNELIEKNEETETIEKPVIVDLPELIAKKQEEDENLKYTPTKEDLEKLENILKRYEGPEEKINNSEPVVLNEEQLKDLEIILNKYQEKFEKNEDKIIEINNVEPTQTKSDEEIVEEIIEETKQVTEVLQEPISFSETTIPNLEDDKKKIPDQNQEISNYKVLSYLKRNG